RLRPGTLPGERTAPHPEQALGRPRAAERGMVVLIRVRSHGGARRHSGDPPDGGLDARLPAAPSRQAAPPMATPPATTRLRRLPPSLRRAGPHGGRFRGLPGALVVGPPCLAAGPLREVVPRGRLAGRRQRPVVLGDDEALRRVACPADVDRPPRTPDGR